MHMLKATDDYKNISVEETLETLQTGKDKGLSGDEAQKRLAEYGYNEIEEKEETLWHRILRRFWGPIPWMIEIAAILSAIVQKWEDFVIIVILLLVNVFIDFRQEAKALSALKMVKEKMALKALALRQGTWAEIDARELVTGDIVKLLIGNIIPADVKLIDGPYLQVDQSALTGESLPADKSTGDVAYANSIVRLGEMIAVVTATGLKTFFGTTVALVAEAEKQQRSHFQKAVINVGNYLILISTVMVVMIIFTGIFRHDSISEILRFALVLTVASIPIALPAVLSVTMAVGAVRLARRQVIVSRLVAIEELAGVDVLCSDKTGTLTKNEMELGEPVTFNNYTKDDALFYASLASREENNDPLEAPIFNAVKSSGNYKKIKEFRQTKFVPFDPIQKRTEGEYEHDDGLIVVTKGAPQAVLALCDDDPALTGAGQQVEFFAEKGYRTLGIAVKKAAEPAFRFVGLLPFYDPPRDDSAVLIEQARNMGVNVKMLTGDNLAISKQIAGILGIEGEIRDVQDLKEEKPQDLLVISDIITESLYRRLKPEASIGEVQAVSKEVVDKLEERLKQIHPGHVRKHESDIIRLIEETGGFAQVFPADKYQIIDRLQKNDHIVAMTGDGVNDAPALKKADAGIAVSGATDAARAAADIVLLEPGLSVIVKAFEEARMIFGRMKSYAIFRISETIRVILFITLSIMIFNFYPVTAIMIIILALLNDIPIMAIAYDNAKVEQKPVKWNMVEVLTVATVLGLAGVTSTFLLFFIMKELNFSQDLIQAVIFLKLDVAGHSTIYVARTGERHFWHKPYPSLKLFIPAFSTRIIGTLIATYGLFMTPVGWTYTAYIYLYATVWFVINDFLKVAVYRMLQNKKWLLGREHAHEAIE